MAILAFLNRLSALQTGEELDGHMSGADAVDTLSALIVEARALAASQPRGELCADGVNVLADCRNLINEAIDVHIYHHDDEVPDDCNYHQALDACDAILSRYPTG